MRKTIDWPAWPIIDELAAEMGVNETTRMKWRQRRVPHRHGLTLLEAATKKGIRLTANDLAPADCREDAPQ